MSLFCCSLPSGSYLRIKCTDCKGPSPALGPGVSGSRLCSAPVPSALSPLLLSSYSSPATPLQLLLSSYSSPAYLPVLRQEHSRLCLRASPSALPSAWNALLPRNFLSMFLTSFRSWLKVSPHQRPFQMTWHKVAVSQLLISSNYHLTPLLFFCAPTTYRCYLFTVSNYSLF